MTRFFGPLAGLALLTLMTGLSGPAAADARLAAVFGGPWTLIAPDGATVTGQSWRGRVVVLYFGYRSCPDVCPTQLQTIAEAMALLGAEAERVQPLFVTLDPERDSREALAAYTALFHVRLIGLTGSPEQIAAIARAYRVAYAKVPVAGGTEYAVDHSTAVYLIDPDGRTAAVLGPDTTVEAMAAAIKALLPPTETNVKPLIRR